MVFYCVGVCGAVIFVILQLYSFWSMLPCLNSDPFVIFCPVLTARERTVNTQMIAHQPMPCDMNIIESCMLFSCYNYFLATLALEC